MLPGDNPNPQFMDAHRASRDEMSKLVPPGRALHQKAVRRLSFDLVETPLCNYSTINSLANPQ
jgi:hypothetical protein